ncbi:hypothetical protein CAPTEDRAFT_222789 [Capitella teleta]|uniref:Iron-binding zinc finger CDGSH type domain-containing protein n=1 Tax=Capitella teleta TaxID=283909 RepID=R7VGS9_CAPTE|nr:hypothetical protein CAPTEDRAFT_222789 [Capitella teleta]|eukprot:ELU18048.1 hypothetical protein CAPTEDRAFT_222789 [Capitella teleta]
MSRLIIKSKSIFSQAHRFTPAVTQSCSFKKNSKDFPMPDPELVPKRDFRVGWAYATESKEVEDPGKGKITHSLPIKLTLEKRAKPYFWCTCGVTKNPPFCDSSHRREEKSYKPMKFFVTETKDYWLCNCKQTDNAPFCDGSHKADEVQSSVKK